VYSTISKLKYKKQLKKAPKMTCIIGGKCSDGVVLVADRRVIYDNGNVKSEEKIFRDYYPFVVASSGSTILFNNFRREALELAQNSLGVYINEQDFKALPFDYRNVSGIIPMYPIPTSYPIIRLYPYLEGLKEIVRKYKNEVKRSNIYNFDVLVASQIQNKGAYLSYIDQHGILGDVPDYIVIGDDKIYGSMFAKSLWKADIKINEFAEIAYFTIKFIDRFKIDYTVGLEGGKPLVYLIPNTGNVDKAPNTLIEEWETNTNKMLDNWEKHGVRKLL
jgi:hypothetical protein